MTRNGKTIIIECCLSKPKSLESASTRSGSFSRLAALPGSKGKTSASVGLAEDVVALYLNRRLWPFTALNSVLPQLWCTCGTCGTFALAPSPSTGVFCKAFPVQSIMMLLALHLGRWCRASSVSSRRAPRMDDRPSDPARSLVWILVTLEGRPGQRSRRYARAEVNICAEKHTRDCTKIASEPI